MGALKDKVREFWGCVGVGFYLRTEKGVAVIGERKGVVNHTQLLLKLSVRWR